MPRRHRQKGAALNPKGRPQKRFADEPSKTKRGRGRAARKAARRCKHEFKRIVPVIGTSYNSDRITRETTQIICTKCGLRRHIGTDT